VSGVEGNTKCDISSPSAWLTTFYSRPLPGTLFPPVIAPPGGDHRADRGAIPLPIIQKL